MNDVRVSVIGTGMVGRWVLDALHSKASLLSARYGFTPRVVGVANARNGFIHDPRGLDLPTVLRLSSQPRSIAEHPGVSRWSSAREGLAATETDVLIEVSSSTREDGEPGVTHMREALRRQTSVVTSNKWPVALHGVELAETARSEGGAFRAESTVMSGTPVLSMLVDGLAGTKPLGLRGVLNATANFILTAMESGKSYDEALDEAQRTGLAERDASADVDGYDSMAKTMILAGLVFGEQLRPDQVFRRGIAGIDQVEVMAATESNRRVRLVSTLEYAGGRLAARVEPVQLPMADPLARIDGVTNAVVCDAQPVGEVTITGPGAGLVLAGQGVLSDLIAIARCPATS